TVLGQGRAPGQRCLIGSVKTNLGHLEGAAGIAGFIKGVLTAHHGAVPANLHFHNPNPAIDWENLNLEVPTRAVSLQLNGHPPTVGVNSFGAGGTNAHAVLQALTTAGTPIHERPMPTNGQGAGGATLYMLSAAHPDALRALALRHADFLKGTQHGL